MAVWNNCDSNSGWAYDPEGGTVTTDSSNKYEGSASINHQKQTTAQGFTFLKNTSMTPIDLSAGGKHITVKIWIEDQTTKDAIASTDFIYIGSNSGSAYNYYTVNWGNFTPGAWNFVDLDFDNPTGTTGGVNSAAINFFSIALSLPGLNSNVLANGKVKIDIIEYGTSPITTTSTSTTTSTTTSTSTSSTSTSTTTTSSSTSTSTTSTVTTTSTTTTSSSTSTTTTSTSSSTTTTSTTTTSTTTTSTTTTYPFNINLDWGF